MSTPSIQELRREYVRRQGRRPLWQRLLLTLAIVFVILILGAYFVLPPLAKSQLQKRLSAALHREVVLEKLQVNPFTLSATLENFSIKERDGTPFVGWSRLFVNFDSASLFTSEWRFQEIALDGFSGHASVNKEGTLNFSDLLAPQTPHAPTTSSKEKSRPIRVAKLSIRDAHLDYADRSLAQPFSTQVGPLTFTLTNFRTTGDSDAPGEFTAATESGETILWNGTVALAPLRSSGGFSLGRIPLKKYAPFYSNLVRFDVTDGIVDLGAKYDLGVKNGKLAVRLTDAGARLQSLKLVEKGKNEPGLTLSTVEVGGVSAELDPQAIEVKTISITGGQISTRRDANGFSLVSLLTPPSISSPSPTAFAPAPTSVTTKPLQVKIGQISARDLAVNVDDHTTPRPANVQLSRVTLSAQNVSLAEPAAPIAFEVSAALPSEGLVRASGNVALQPLKADITLQAKNVSLPLVSPYAESLVNARVASGAVNASGKLYIEADVARPLAISGQGDVAVSNFSIVESASGEAVASWKNLAITGAEYTSEPARLVVAEIELDEPVSELAINPDHSLNFAALMKNPDTAKGAPAVQFNQTKPAAASPLFAEIDKIAINSASLNYVDRSIQPNVKTGVNQLTGTIAGLSSANLARADVNLRGVVQNAPVSITGQINPLGGEAFTDLKVAFDRVELVPFGPYVAKFAGHELDRGSLTLDIKLRVARRRLDSANVATLNQFDLGKPSNSPDATNLPVGLAIALLRDTQGKIVIDLPIQGNLDDPSFRIGRVVGRVLVNLLTKAATSPFSLIGSMFGGGKGEDLSYQSFPAGSSTLEDDAIKKLDVVAKALRERPALRLEIEGSSDKAADLPALRENELQKRIRNAFWEEARKTDPNLISPDQVTFSHQDEIRIITEFYREALGQARPETPAATTNAEPAPKRRWFLFRLFHRSPTTPAPKAPTPTTPRVPSAPEPLPPFSEMRTKLVEAIDIDENALHQLAASRAEKVQQYLTTSGNVTADRVSLVAPASTTNGQGARVNLHLR